MSKIAVIGAGNAGSTVAAHLKLLGKDVSLYDVAENQLIPILESGNTVHLSGALDVSGEARIDLVTMNISEAVEGAELIICTTPAHVHKFVAKDLAPHLVSGQFLLLNPGRTGGVLEVRKVLEEQGCRADVTVVEAQTILYACRKDGANINVFGVKEEVACAGLPGKNMPRFFEIIQSVFPQFQPAKGGVWDTSLNNIGMLFHPAPTLLNLGRMESGQPFDYYIDGFSPSVADTVEKLDADRLKVAQAMGVTPPTTVEWLKNNYHTTGENLYEALQNNEAYRGIKAPMLSGVEAKMGLRYVIEDVPSGLVPVSELGKKFGVETPAIDAVIALADVMFNADFRATGRNLQRLGLEGMTVEEIRNL